MQILESSMLGLRAARLVLCRPGSRTSVTLLPVIHIGDRAFYDAVRADALAHDVVLLEGVKSPVAWRLTRVYRWIDTARLGLVVQPGLEVREEAHARLILADLSTEEFHAEWRKVPLWLRAALSVGAPFAGLWLRFFATRERIADREALDDSRSEDEILSWRPERAALEHSLLHARDARLVRCLEQEIDDAEERPLRIAIVFGARHIRAVLAALSRRGFICTGSEWRTVIAL